MVKPVNRIIPDFARAGANVITFHPEASEHVDRGLGLIRDSGCQAGLVFNPATSLYLDGPRHGQARRGAADEREPGFGGQKFIAGTLDKLREARARIDAYEARSNVASRSRSTAALRSTISQRSRQPVPTPSSPARRCSARRGEDPARLRYGDRRAACCNVRGQREQILRDPRGLAGPRRHHADTIHDLAEAANRTLAELGPGRSVEENPRLRRQGHPEPRPPTLTEGSAASDEEIEAALPIFRRHYAFVNGSHTRIYPGVVEGLAEMRAMGFALGCVTNKSGEFTMPLLERMGIADSSVR